MGHQNYKVWEFSFSPLNLKVENNCWKFLLSYFVVITGSQFASLGYNKYIECHSIILVWPCLILDLQKNGSSLDYGSYLDAKVCECYYFSFLFSYFYFKYCLYGMP